MRGVSTLLDTMVHEVFAWKGAAAYGRKYEVSLIKTLQKYQVLISLKGNKTRQRYHADFFIYLMKHYTNKYIYMLLYLLYFLILILHCFHSSFYSNELYAVAVVM